MEFAILIIVACFVFVIIYSIKIGAVYTGTPNSTVSEIIKLAKIKKGERAIDLGSGDGRIVREFAKKGIESHGIEINPILVVWSRLSLWLSGNSYNTHIYFGSILSHNLSSYDVVTLFVVPYIMRDIEKKLKKELKPGTRVIVETFPFKNWKPEKKSGSLYLYKI